MKELVGTAVNFVKVLAHDNKWQTSLEMVVVVSEPVYAQDAAGAMVKSRATESIRFATSVDGAKDLAAEILGWVELVEKAEKEDGE